MGKHVVGTVVVASEEHDYGYLLELAARDLQFRGHPDERGPTIGKKWIEGSCQTKMKGTPTLWHCLEPDS